MSPENNVQGRNASGVTSTVHHQTLPPYFLVINVEEAVSPKLDHSATQDGTQRRRNNEDGSVELTAKPTTTTTAITSVTVGVLDGFVVHIHPHQFPHNSYPSLPYACTVHPPLHPKPAKSVPIPTCCRFPHNLILIPIPP